MACQQLAWMLTSTAWRVTERVHTHCDPRNKTLWAGQVPEDGFNYSKAAARRVADKELSHRSVWMAPIKRRVLENVHRWKRPRMEQLGSLRNFSIPESSFVPKAGGAWAKLQDIKSTREPTWHSPGPERLSEHWGAQVLFQLVVKYGLQDKLGNTWLQVLFNGGEMLVRDKAKKVRGGSWMFPLAPLGPSVFLAWLVEELVVDGLGSHMFLPSLLTEGFSGDLVDFAILILEIDDWNALEYSWASPLHQLLFARGVAGFAAKNCSVAVQSHSVETLRQCAARNADRNLRVTPSSMSIGRAP